MNERHSIAMLRVTGAFAFALCAAGAAPVLAQDTPSYATATDAIRGTIAALPGRFALVLDDERGFQDSVTLHDGTEIEPQGVTLQVGQAVTVLGHTDGKTFAADEIDTDGADTSSGYDTAPPEPYAGPADGSGYAGSSYGYGGYGGYGGYAGGIYPAYVIPLGGSAYYYGSGAYGGGIYYNGGGGANHPHHGPPGYAPIPVIRGNPVVHGANPVLRGQAPPVVSPIVRSHGGVSPVRSAPAVSAPRAYAPVTRSAPASFRGR